MEKISNNINRMANVMRQFADELDHIANELDETGDITYTSEAAQAVVNCLINLKIHLLVSQPIRELGKKEKK